MATSAADMFKRAFSKFETVAKRDPKDAGAIEIDVGKVATDVAKAAAGFGPSGDLEALAKALDEIDDFLTKVSHDPTTDTVVAGKSALAEKFAKADGRYYVDHGSGAAKPPAKGSKEQKQNQYTGVSNESGEEYTDTTNASMATTPSGGDASAAGFDQPSGGPNTGTKKGAGAPAPTAKRAKAQQPAHPETPGSPGMLLEENEVQPQDSMVSEGFGMNGKKPVKKAAGAKQPVKKNARITTIEEIWARDMADMSKADVELVRKNAKESDRFLEDDLTAEEVEKAGALDGDEDGDATGETAPRSEPDDRSSADAKRKAKAKTAKAAGKNKAQYDAETQTVDELEGEERQSASATKPNAGDDPTDAQTVDDVEGGNKAAGYKGKAAKAKKSLTGTDQTGAVDEVEETAKGKKPPFPPKKPADDADEGDDDDEDDKPKAKAAKKAAKPADDEDSDGDEDAESEEEEAAEDDDKPKARAKTKKSADEDDDRWERDMSPAESPVLKSARQSVDSVAARPGDVRSAQQRHARIRKMAAEGLSPDQIAVEERRRKLTPEERRRERVNTLKSKEYSPGQGYQPGMVEGVVDEE